MMDDYISYARLTRISSHSPRTGWNLNTDRAIFHTHHFPEPYRLTEIRMRHHIPRAFFAVLLSMVTISVAGAQGWTQLTPGTGKSLRGIFSASASMTIAAGDDGLVIGTTDGGVTWSSGNAGTSEDLHKVFVMNTFAPVIAVVGDNGTMRSSTNVGISWNTWNGGTNENLYDIFVHDPVAGTTITVVGESGVILFSNNGGNTWVFRLSPVAKRLNGVFFTDLLNGLIVGDGGVILRTSNGGSAWVQISSGTSIDLNHVFFTDANNGFVAGDGGLLMNTTDGGLTWSTVTTPTIRNLNRLFFGSANDGWAVGERGTIIHTSDGGNTWSTQASGVTEHLHSVFFTDPTTGMVVGDNGTVLKTTNGGVPVELTAFSALPMGSGGVALQWRTASEEGNFGFEVQRYSRGDWEVLGFVAGAGDSRRERSYRYVDASPPADTPLKYRLRQIDLDGRWEFSPVLSLDNPAPLPRITLHAAPNPARTSSTIHLRLFHAASLRLAIHSVDGRRIALLHDGPVSAGTHAFHWNATGLPAGMYIASLDASGMHARATIMLTP